MLNIIVKKKMNQIWIDNECFTFSEIGINSKMNNEKIEKFLIEKESKNTNKKIEVFF
jgi:hypothetical protein